MRSLLTFLAFSLVQFTVLAAACAQDLYFDADQWGNSNLVIRQSTGNTTLEALISGNRNLERLYTYDKESRLRRLSRPVGRLDIRFADREFVTCTATLIQESLILTNYHCVPNLPKTLNEKGGITDVTLVMNHYDDRDVAGVERYRVDLRPVEQNSNLDYSILQVDGAPGRKWGTVRVRKSPPRPGMGLLVIHHPGGQPKHVTRGGCRAANPATDAEAIQLFHLCDTLPGSSGAPIFADDDGAMVGFHRAGPTFVSLGSTNFGVVLAALDSATAFETLQGEVESSRTLKTALLYQRGEPTHIGDEDFGSWPPTVGSCLNVDVEQSKQFTQLSLTLKAYGAENTSVVIDGRARPLFNQVAKPGAERPNYWSETQQVSFALGDGAQTPRLIQICGNEVKKPIRPGDRDDFMVKDLTISGTYYE